MKQVTPLRDCPFCGSKFPPIARIELDNKKFKYQATCSEISCQASMSKPTQEELVLAWNRCSPMDPRDHIISDLMDTLETYTEESFYTGEDGEETVLFEVERSSDFLKDFYRRGDDKDDPSLPGKMARDSLSKARKHLQELKESSRIRKKVIKSRRKRPSDRINLDIESDERIEDIIKSIQEDEEEENT